MSGGAVRGRRSMSVAGAPAAVPASMAGLPSCRWPSKASRLSLARPGEMPHWLFGGQGSGGLLTSWMIAYEMSRRSLGRTRSSYQ